MKNTFIISYDLPPDANSAELRDAIKAYKNWAKVTSSCWLIVTEEKAKNVRDNLIEKMPNGSRLLVVKSSGVGAWRNTICSNTWLKKNL